MASFQSSQSATAQSPTLIYHEKQVSLMCGQHCLNNACQGPYFDVELLSNIAQELDNRERELMMEMGVDTTDAIRFAAEDSGNVDESGNFSLMVLQTAIRRRFGVELVRVKPRRCGSDIPH